MDITVEDIPVQNEVQGGTPRRRTRRPVLELVPEVPAVELVETDSPSFLEGVDWDSVIPPEAFKDTALQIAESIYPNCVDIVAIREREYLTIYFERGTILNSRGESHNIYDLYVGIPFNSSGSSFDPSVHVTRGEVTAFESLKNYAHSHCSDGIGDAFMYTCLGNGDLAQELSRVMTNPTYRRVFAIISMVEILNRWESLEGTPYKYIKSLSGTEFINSYRVGGGSSRSTNGWIRYPDFPSIFDTFFCPIILQTFLNRPRLCLDLMDRAAPAATPNTLCFPSPRNLIVRNLSLLDTLPLPMFPDEFFDQFNLKVFYLMCDVPVDVVNKYLQYLNSSEGARPTTFNLPPLESIPADIRLDSRFTFKGRLVDRVEIIEQEVYREFYENHTNTEGTPTDEVTLTHEEWSAIRAAQSLEEYREFKRFAVLLPALQEVFKADLHNKLRVLQKNILYEYIKGPIERCVGHSF